MELRDEHIGKERFGREATLEEQEQYPIEELLKILNKEITDFPYH